MPPMIALTVGIRAGSDFSCDDVTQCATKHKAAAEEAAGEMVSYSAHMLTVVANAVIQDIGAAVRIMPKRLSGSMM
ncbi:hypothetical protein LA080_000908 [Diaporthe eres]|nr:hypothetical protein LA080_000908 [Diaporthe eres]